MEFFEGFRWAVPRAFADSVSLCRFQEGDTLYDTRKAYEGMWGEAQKHIEFSAQVRFPSATLTPVAGDSGNVFARNWNSEVRVDLRRKGVLTGGESVRSTQGRLYTLLWKGDVQVLYADSPPPSIPLNVQETTKVLSDHKGHLAERCGNRALFALPYDPANSISRTKYSKVEKALQKILTDPPLLLRTKESGLPNWDSMAPTIVIALFCFKQSECDSVTELLKKALYVPTEGAKKEMFRMSAHGVLVSGIPNAERGHKIDGDDKWL